MAPGPSAGQRDQRTGGLDLCFRWLEPTAAKAGEARSRNRGGACRTLAATPEQLFGGQQRVAMARALATPTESILFDEPTRAVDPRMAADVFGVITGLATSGQKMIVVTHAMGFARDASHTVTVMPADRVAESGPPEQIFENPREDVTRTFLAMTKAN